MSNTQIKWGGHYLTDEQVNALELAKTGEWLKIEAYAGSGKTTLLNVIATLGLENKRVLYLAFNRSIVTEGQRIFPKNVTCKTTHSLAGGSTVAWYGKRKGDNRFDKQRLGNINGAYIEREFEIGQGYSSPILAALDLEFSPLDIAYLAIAAIERFCTCADQNIGTYHVWNDSIHALRLRAEMESDTKKRKDIICAAIEVQRIGLEWANKIWDRMIDPDGSCRITHNTYLKVWGLSSPVLDKFDTILLDEGQDSNSLILEVLLNQKHTQTIVVGDHFQSIYSWNGAVNAMKTVSTKHNAVISQSFRFGTKIADLASSILSYVYGRKIDIKGFDAIPSEITKLKKYSAYIARTNANLIEAVMLEIEKGNENKIAIEGGINEMIKLLQSAESLQNGEKVKTGDLSGFMSWDEVVTHSNTEVGASLKVLVQLVDKYGADTLIKRLESCNSTNDTSKASLVFTTAHKSKGKEYFSVKISGDFRELTSENKEEANLLYVACTRATHYLDISECKAITECDALERFAKG